MTSIYYFTDVTISSSVTYFIAIVHCICVVFNVYTATKLWLILFDSSIMYAPATKICRLHVVNIVFKENHRGLAGSPIGRIYTHSTSEKAQASLKIVSY